jgi:hypothetical protein
MHLGASRSYEIPLRGESIFTVVTGRMILASSEEFAAEIRSYVDFTQSRSRNNLEASINGAAGVFLQVAVHASHGESGLAEWPGFSQNTAKAAVRDREWRLRRHELMFSPRDLDLVSLPYNYFISMKGILPKSTTCFVITRKARLHPLLRFGPLLVRVLVFVSAHFE